MREFLPIRSFVAAAVAALPLASRRSGLKGGKGAGWWRPISCSISLLIDPSAIIYKYLIISDREGKGRN